jgi:serine/threonine protein kinase/CheY-like chemotaxis protein
MIDKTVVEGLTRPQFLEALEKSGLLSSQQVETLAESQATADVTQLKRALVESGMLTWYQCESIAQKEGDRLLIGNYEVLDRLGAGGMGTVFKARHRRMKRIVALKVLAKELSSDPNFVHRFQREVETIARLSHPNVVMAYDADEAAIGHFLVMEFVEGKDLATLVAKAETMEVPVAVHCILEAARGLAYAHRQGIVHRDIKPANLLLDVSGNVKVADLGLARINTLASNNQETAESSLTKVGGIMGTADFMPPEQAMDAASADQRADVYSLGCTLYFVLTSKAPYAAPNLMATLIKHRDAPVPSLRAIRAEIPEELDRCFARMVAKKPEDRYQSMEEVVASLQAIQASLQGVASQAAGPIAEAAKREDVARPWSALLVEPSRTQAGIIRKYLQSMGQASVVTVGSGKEALKSLESSVPDVVICTMFLDDMNGDELAVRVHALSLDRRPGFVLISGQDADRQSLSQEIGVTLHKPFAAAALAAAVSASCPPLRWLSSVSVPHSSASAKPASVSLIDRSKLRVLIVDDSAAARLHERTVLHQLGFVQFAEAPDGVQAVAAVCREKFDLIVTDYNMPLLDGRGFIEFLKHNPSTVSVPVLMVTTETDPSMLEAVRALGVLAICAKSFSTDDIRRIVDPVF